MYLNLDFKNALYFKKEGDKYVVYKKTGKRVGATKGTKEALKKRPEVPAEAPRMLIVPAIRFDETPVMLTLLTCPSL